MAIFIGGGILIGIYRIYNTVNCKSYVGQSRNIPNRIARHKSMLNSNVHPNSALQEDWGRYSSDFFRFDILERCKVEFLDEKEVEYISALNSTADGSGYNLTYGGLHPQKYSETSKSKMSCNNSGTGNPNYGKHLSNNTKDLIRKTKYGDRNAAAKLKFEQAAFILQSSIPASSLANMFGVSLMTIYNIKNRRTWKCL